MAAEILKRSEGVVHPVVPGDVWDLPRVVVQPAVALAPLRAVAHRHVHVGSAAVGADQLVGLDGLAPAVGGAGGAGAEGEEEAGEGGIVDLGADIGELVEGLDRVAVDDALGARRRRLDRSALRQTAGGQRGRGSARQGASEAGGQGSVSETADPEEGRTPAPPGPRRHPWERSR